MSIAFKEGLTIPAPAVNEIILAANQDIRQVIYSINLTVRKFFLAQMWQIHILVAEVQVVPSPSPFPQSKFCICLLNRWLDISEIFLKCQETLSRKKKNISSHLKWCIVISKFHSLCNDVHNKNCEH